MSTGRSPAPLLFSVVPDDGEEEEEEDAHQPAYFPFCMIVTTSLPRGENEPEVPVMEEKLPQLKEKDFKEVDKENINGESEGVGGENAKEEGEGEETQQQSSTAISTGGSKGTKTDPILSANITLALSRLGLSDGPDCLGLPENMELADISTDSSDNSSVCSWSSSSFAASGSDGESDDSDLMDDDDSVISTDSCPR